MVDTMAAAQPLVLTQEESPAISANDVSVSFGERVILDNVSIELNSGEVTTLLGPNGAGKSTLLKLLCGETDSEANVAYFGRSRKQWNPKILSKHLGLLPQHSTLSFPFLASEVVELGAIPLGMPNKDTKKLALQYMQQADVVHLANRLYPSLSGGEKQRVHLARVLTQLHLSGDKKILMLDEPTSALDLAHQHNTLAIARELADNHNTAVVVVLHDLNLASQYSDRIVILHNGKLVADGAPKDAINSEMIERVYGYKTIITRHPQLGFPVVLAS
jgi:iron complex transport system ATP-binding protein